MSAGILVTDTDVGPFARSLGQGASIRAPSGDVAMDANGKFTIANGAVTGAKLKKFVSTEQTGTGSEQTIAHGLGVVPSVVLVVPTELPAGLAAGYDCAEGDHTSTNVVVTVTSGAKFKVIAIA